MQKFKPPNVETKLGDDIPEIIEHRKNGLRIESGDSKSLAAAILAFISTEKLAALCAANGLRYAIEHFSFDDIDRGKASSRGCVGKHRDGKTASCAQLRACIGAAG